MIHFLFTMHAARHALESGQYVVADGRDAKRQQYRLGVAQCVELATQVDREFVEGLLQRPTLAVEFPKKKSRTRSANWIRMRRMQVAQQSTLLGRVGSEPKRADGEGRLASGVSIQQASHRTDPPRGFVPHPRPSRGGWN